MLKTFLIRCGCFALLLTLVLASLAHLPASPRQSSYLSALIDKHRLLKQQPGPRVVLVGGSNVAFGVDSERLSELLGIAVVNTGLHADLGLKFMLEDVADYLRPKDILVLMPEFELFRRPTRGGETLAVVLVDIDSQGWQYLDPLEKLQILTFVVPNICKKTLYWAEVGINYLLAREVDQSTLELYNRQAFNKFGDMVGHWKQPPQVLSPAVRPPKASIDTDLVRFVGRMVEEQTTRGVRCIILPPVIRRADFDAHSELIESVQLALEDSRIGFSALPERYALRNDQFFNTLYHPNKGGLDDRTRLLSEDLTRYLGNDSSAGGTSIGVRHTD